MASRTPNQVSQLYEKVIQDVITNVRDSFLDDGVDEQVLMELKQIWEAKLSQTKAVDSPTIGDRVRPTYSYTAMPTQKGPVLYQVPTGVVHHSQQQARAGPGIIYPRGGNIVLPTTHKMFSSYQPAVAALRHPVSQQVIPGGDTIVLASSSNVSQQSSNKPGSSNVVQVDGSSDEPKSVPEGRIVTDILEQDSTDVLKKVFPTKKTTRKVIMQFDGKGDSSSSDDELGDDDDEDDDDDDDDADDDEAEESQEKDTEDEEPLNSNDDDSDDDDAGELFDVENVVVCQYDKIHRAKAKWKFNLKVGIMNLEGKDHVFLKANGEADW